MKEKFIKKMYSILRQPAGGIHKQNNYQQNVSRKNGGIHQKIITNKIHQG